MVSTVWDAICSIISAVINVIKTIITTVFTAIGNFFSTIWNAIKTTISNVITGIYDGIVNKFNAVKEFITTLFTTIKTTVSNIWNSIKTSIINVITNIVNGVRDKFNNMKTNITNIFNNIKNSVINIFNNIKNSLVNVVSNMWSAIKNKFSTLGTAIGEAISGAVKSAVNWILTKIENVINNFFRLINAGIDVINAIPGVNIVKLNMLSIPKLAKGGIVNQPTQAIIGEAGKEAVLPLENNTEWMDILAGKIATILGSSFNNDSSREIVIKFDGTLAQLIRVLKPELDRESNRRGDKLIVGGVL